MSEQALVVRRFEPLSALTQQRGRFVQLMRRHVLAQDVSKTDHDLAQAVYFRFLKAPELWKSKEVLPRQTAQLFDQRQRYTEIMRRHVHADDEGKSDIDFVRDVYARYAHWREVPLIDPNE